MHILGQKKCFFMIIEIHENVYSRSAFVSEILGVYVVILSSTGI